MNNAVIYARFSSVGQNEQTIDGQLRICREYAEKLGYTVVKTYNDKARTGTNDKRPDFQRMVVDASTGAFQHIIVYKFDRFARNRLDSMMYKTKLKNEYGVRVQSATEPVSDDEGGEIYEMFLEWNDEKYSQRLSKRVRDGLTTAMENGTYTGQCLIFGYRLVDTDKVGKKGIIHRVVIDEQQAEIVRFIFTEYADGTPKKEIADKMNAKGWRYKDQPFTARTFDLWLRNAKYTGVFNYGGRVSTKIYPRIIDQELWDRVQQALDKNKKFTKANRVREKYLFCGKIFCGHCGRYMTADGANKTTMIYRYYGCKNTRKKICDKKIESKERIENFVLEQITQYLSDPKRVAVMADEVIKYYEHRTGENEIKNIEQRIKTAEQQIKETTNAFITACTMNSEPLKKNCQEKIDELTTLIDDLSHERTQLQFEQGMQTTKQDIVMFVERFIRPSVYEYAKGDSTDQQQIIENLVRAIYVYNDKIVVWFNIGNGNKDILLPNKETTDNIITMPTSSATVNYGRSGGI